MPDLGRYTEDAGATVSDLSGESIRAGLQTSVFGRVVYYWPAIASTNDELKRLADQGAPEGALAITDHQLAGRGRLQRTWIASAGSSLLTSLLFRPSFLSLSQASQLTMLCSLAMADAVDGVAGLQPALKWPNDLLLGSKKLAGVLTELGIGQGSAAGAALEWVVVGVGLNVNLDFAAQVPELAETAVSLATALGRPVPRLPLLQTYLVNVEARYEALRAGHSPLSEWTARLATLGQAMTIHAPDGVYEGLAESVDETGALLLRLADGRSVRILTGDVVLQPG